MATGNTKTSIWMPLYIGDYLADTAHLTTEQSGAYLHLLMHYWKTGPLPNNDQILAQITRLTPDAWSIAQALLKSFFKLEADGLLHQKRVDAELEGWRVKRLKAKEKAEIAASMRWRNHAPSIPPSNTPSTPQAMLGSCPSPSPSPTHISTKEKSTPPEVSLPDWLPSDAWEAFQETRKALRAPITAKARFLLIKKLTRLRKEGHDPREVLEQSIQNSYRGIFETKKENGNGRSQQGAIARVNSNVASFAEVLKRSGDYEGGRSDGTHARLLPQPASTPGDADGV